MAAIHRENEVEIGEVALRHLPRALRALVGRRAHVPIADAGGRDAKLDALLRREMAQHRLRGRRAADVPRANE
jgi:hypothetical protein